MVADSPLTVGPPTGASATGLDTATLTAGRIVEARITALAGQMATLASRQGPLEVDLGTRPAAVGDVVRFEVKAVDGGDGQTRLSLELMPPSTSEDPRAAVTASPADLARRALGQAVARAAVGQSGLAPLYATLSGLASAPRGSVPEPVAALVGRLLDGRLAAGAPPTATSVASAFRNSGLFLEAKTSTAVAAPTAAGDDLKSLLGRLREALTAWVGASPASGKGGAAVSTAAAAVPSSPSGDAGARSAATAGASARGVETPASASGLAVRAAYGGAANPARPMPSADGRGEAPARLAAQAYGAGAPGNRPMVTVTPLGVSSPATPPTSPTPQTTASGAAVAAAGSDPALPSGGTGAATVTRPVGSSLPENAPTTSAAAAPTGRPAATLGTADGSPAPRVAAPSASGPAPISPSTITTSASPTPVATAGPGGAAAKPPGDGAIGPTSANASEASGAGTAPLRVATTGSGAAPAPQTTTPQATATGIATPGTRPVSGETAGGPTVAPSVVPSPASTDAGTSRPPGRGGEAASPTFASRPQPASTGMPRTQTASTGAAADPLGRSGAPTASVAGSPGAPTGGSPPSAPLASTPSPAEPASGTVGATSAAPLTGAGPAMPPTGATADALRDPTAGRAGPAASPMPPSPSTAPSTGVGTSPTTGSPGSGTASSAGGPAGTGAPIAVSGTGRPVSPPAASFSSPAVASPPSFGAIGAAVGAPANAAPLPTSPPSSPANGAADVVANVGAAPVAPLPPSGGGLASGPMIGDVAVDPGVDFAKAGLDPLAALAEGETGVGDPARSAAALAGGIRDRATRPPPPRRGQAPVAQAASPRETAVSAEAAEGLGRRALERTEGALQRILLEQWAVLDRGGEEAGGAAARTGREWTAELPLATPAGTSVVQMTVERDGGGKSGTASEIGWRVRFALDVEPIGPVHVQIGLSGEHLSVGLWIERPEMAARLAADVGELAAALTDGGTTIEAVHVTQGTPPAARPEGGASHFVDVSL